MSPPGEHASDSSSIPVLIHRIGDSRLLLSERSFNSRHFPPMRDWYGVHRQLMIYAMLLLPGVLFAAPPAFQAGAPDATLQARTVVPDVVEAPLPSPIPADDSDRGIAGLRGLIVENRGQVTDGSGHRSRDAAYAAQVGDLTLYFTRQGVSYVFADAGDDAERSGSRDSRGSSDAAPAFHRMDLELVGASRDMAIQPGKELDGGASYYLPHVADGIVDVPAYRSLLYQNVYRNVDLLFFTEGGTIHSRFIIRPGGRAASIRLRFTGARSVAVSDQGLLDVVNPLGAASRALPAVYQALHANRDVTAEGNRAEIESRFREEHGVIGVEVGEYDDVAPLLIESRISWGGDARGSAEAIAAADSSRGVTLAASVRPFVYPASVGRLENPGAASVDLVVTHLDSDGTRRWSTIIGGTGDDLAQELTVDRWGNTLMLGATESDDFAATRRGGKDARGNGAFALMLDCRGRRLWAMPYEAAAGGCDEVMAPPARTGEGR